MQPLQRFTYPDPAFIEKLNSNAAVTEAVLNMTGRSVLPELELCQRGMPELLSAALGTDRAAILDTMQSGAEASLTLTATSTGAIVQLNPGYVWLGIQQKLVHVVAPLIAPGIDQDGRPSPRLTRRTAPRLPVPPTPLPADPSSYFDDHPPCPTFLHLAADGSSVWLDTLHQEALYAIDVALYTIYWPTAWLWGRTVLLDATRFAKNTHEVKFHRAGGVTTAGALVGLRKLARPIAVAPGLSGSTCAVGTNPAAPAVLTIKAAPRAVDVAGGTTVGTATIAPDGSVTFESDGFRAAAGTVLAVFGPVPADQVMADVALTIAATLGGA